jgi:hypothetical protein
MLKQLVEENKNSTNICLYFICVEAKFIFYISADV